MLDRLELHVAHILVIAEIGCGLFGLRRRRRRFGCIGGVAAEHARDGVAEQDAASDAHRGLRRTGKKTAATCRALRGHALLAPWAGGAGSGIGRRGTTMGPAMPGAARRGLCGAAGRDPLPNRLENNPPPEDCCGWLAISYSSCSMRCWAAFSACSCTTMVCAIR